MKKSFNIEFKNEGYVISESKSATALLKAYDFIGLDRINKDNIVLHSGYNVVSKDERPAVNGCKSQTSYKGFYVWTHLNNNDKIKDLVSVATFYGLDIAIYEGEGMKDDQKKDDQKKDDQKKDDQKKDDQKKVIRAADYEYIKAQIIDNIPVYLYGPAGTGKTQLAMDLAKDLGLDFYMTSSVLESVQLAGYGDGYGVFHDTEFFKAFTQGGLFLFDEIDISNPIEVKAFNCAISQKVYIFNGKQYKAHKDFRVMAAGNTLGTGSNETYEGNVLDPSVRDRFEAVYFGYDERIEMLITKNDQDLVDFTHALRNAVNECGIDFVVSYRALVKFMQKRDQINRGICSLPRAINQSYTSFLDSDNKMILANNIKGNNKYIKAFKEAVNM